MTQDWQMPRRNDRCVACGRDIEPGAALQACLWDAPAGYERRDYCPECEVPADPAPIARWRSRRPLPPQRKAAGFDREAVWGLFLRLAEPASTDQVRLRFVLALLLWRKKVLRLEESGSHEGREVWRFRAVGAEAHDVERPDLTDAQIENLSSQLEQLLSSDGTASVVGAPETAP